MWRTGEKRAHISSTSYHNTISYCPDRSRGFAGEGEDHLGVSERVPNEAHWMLALVGPVL